MAKVLKKENLSDFLKYLEGKYTLLAPVKCGEHESGFKKITAGEFCYSHLMQPEGPKKYIFPPISEMFKEGLPKKNIVIGVSYQDINGIALMDTVFKFPICDEEYFNIRKQYLIVGMDRFSPPKEGFDLYFQVQEDFYGVFSGSATGAKFLKLRFFEEGKEKAPKVSFVNSDVLNDPRLSAAVEKGRDSKVWKDLSKVCLGCGICTYVCPVCYCFDTRDSFNLRGKTKRERCWDSCLLSSFSIVAGGHNFRSDLEKRLYNWYFHKFVRMPRELKRIGCVGCSRCITYCPARINFHEVLQQLILELEGKRVKKLVHASKG